jgi:PAS domain S-box-containing protein
MTDDRETVLDEMKTLRESYAAELKNRHVFVVENDKHLAKELDLQLRHAGYEVSVFDTPEKLKENVEKTHPAAILMDIIFPHGKLAGIEAIIEIQHDREPLIPVIFMSKRDDMEARLSAARAGAMYYFTKPFDVDNLVQALDELTAERTKEPYRVLIVDDDVFVTKLYSFALERAGMLTSVVNDPMEALERIAAFKPELILMDVYMPNCKGTELAAVIRQGRKYTDVPIVFLSAETDFDKQMAALNLGGDDFLNKSIDINSLVKMITPRVKRARILNTLTRELRDSERKYRGVVDNINIGIVLMDRDMEILSLNPQIQHWFPQLYQGALWDNPFNDLPQDDNGLDLPWMLCLRDGSVHEAIIKTLADDAIKHYRVVSSPILDEKGEVVNMIQMVEDISDRVQAEKALKEAKDYIENIINSMADSLIVIKPDLTINFVNRATCELLGYTEQELSERSIDHIFYGGISFEKTLLEEIMEKGFVKNPEMLYMNKSNQKIPVSFLSTAMYEDVERKKNPVGIICIAHDMRAIEELQKKVRHAEKMAATGVLSAGVAHEIKNPLAIIIQGLESLKFSLSSIPKNALIQDTIGRIRKAALRADKIVKGLSDFSRQTSMTFEKLDIHKVIEETISLVGQQFSLKDIKIIRQFSPDLEKIVADNDQIKQVFINLLINAVEAMPGGGMITISTQLYEPRSEEKYLNITFADTGCGISEESMQKVFEPFFSTKTKTLSTGLGLSITRGIIEKHGGNIEIESETGKGTKVVVSLAYNFKEVS